MIYTSDNEIYEDEMAHALGVKDEASIHYKDYLSTMAVSPKPTPEETQIGPELEQKPVTQEPNRMPPSGPTEPVGESKEKTLYIIRHGATAMNNDTNTSADRIRGWTDVPLTEEGRQDAEKAGQKLKGMETPTTLHHSDLDRATETASIISKHIGVEPTASRNLRPWDLGTLTGKSTKEAIPQIEEYVRNKPDTPVPKGESFNEFKERAFKGIHNALDSGDSPVAIVTHHRLERLLEAWDAKGQPADHSIDLNVFTQKGDPPGGIKTLKVKAGGDQIQQQLDMEDQADSIDRWLNKDPEKAPDMAFMKAGKIPPTGDLSDVEPSHNIIHRGVNLTEQESSRNYAHELASGLTLDRELREEKNNPNPLSKAIGIEDVQKHIDKALEEHNKRIDEKLEHFKKMWQEIKPQ